MHEFPNLKTKRLTLTMLMAEDIPAIVKYAGNAKITEMTLTMPHPYTEQDAIAWINRANQGFMDQSEIIFGIKFRETAEFMGSIGLKINQRFDHAELGYWVAVPFWNNGFASEAVKAILEFGFNKLKLNKIFAYHFTINPGSGKVLIKNNMIKEGELKAHIKKDGQYLDVIQYRLTKSEYKEK